MTEEERFIFEQGFEEGYAVARRNYEASSVVVFTKEGVNIVKTVVSPKKNVE